MTRDSGSVVYELALLPHLCELYLRTGRSAEAGEHLVQARNILSGSADWAALLGDLLLADGLVLSDQGLWNEAEGAFQTAIENYQMFERPWDEARACYEWAVALMGAQEDVSHASRPRDLLQKALSLWEPMGASLYADRCRARLGQ